MDTTYIINHRDIVSRVEIPTTDSVNVCELSDVVTELSHINESISEINAMSMSSVLGMPEGVASIVIPTAVTLIVFILSELVVYWRNKKQQQKDRKKYRNIVFQWCDVISPIITNQINACNSFSEILKASIDLQPESFVFTKSCVDKIKSIGADKLIEVFVMKPDGKVEKDKNATYTYNIISQFEYLSFTEIIIDRHYNKYHELITDLQQQWNSLDDTLSEALNDCTEDFYVKALELKINALKTYKRNSSHDYLTNYVEPLIQIALSDKYLKTQNISKVIDVLRQYIMIEEHRKSICDSYKEIFETIAENMRQSYESLQKACAYLKD